MQKINYRERLAVGSLGFWREMCDWLKKKPGNVHVFCRQTADIFMVGGDREERKKSLKAL